MTTNDDGFPGDGASIVRARFKDCDMVGVELTRELARRALDGSIGRELLRVGGDYPDEPNRIFFSFPIPPAGVDVGRFSLWGKGGRVLEAKAESTFGVDPSKAPPAPPADGQPKRRAGPLAQRRGAIEASIVKLEVPLVFVELVRLGSPSWRGSWIESVLGTVTFEASTKRLTIVEPPPGGLIRTALSVDLRDWYDATAKGVGRFPLPAGVPPFWRSRVVMATVDQAVIPGGPWGVVIARGVGPEPLFFGSAGSGPGSSGRAPITRKPVDPTSGSSDGAGAQEASEWPSS